MFAALFHSHGPPGVIRLEELPRPVPGPGELLVEVRAVGLNHLDLWVRRGLPGTSLPHVGGSDLAGVVAEVGEGVTGWGGGERVVVNPSLHCGRCRACLRGQEAFCAAFRVLGEHTPGGFAEFVSVPAANAYLLPDSYPFELAAALPVSYQTAWRALLTRARLQSGEDVLVLGASGATAIAAIQIAKRAGARVFAVTHGRDKADKVRAVGADVVYDRSAVDFSSEVYRETGKRGVDVVVENVGEATWRRSLRALARGGRLVTYGATTGPVGHTDLRLLFWKQLEIIGSTMASRAEFEEMLRVALRGDLVPEIDSVLPLERLAAAHARLEAGEQFGKIVLTP